MGFLTQKTNKKSPKYKKYHQNPKLKQKAKTQTNKRKSRSLFCSSWRTSRMFCDWEMNPNFFI